MRDKVAEDKTLAFLQHSGKRTGGGMRLHTHSFV